MAVAVAPATPPGDGTVERTDKTHDAEMHVGTIQGPHEFQVVTPRLDDSGTSDSPAKTKEQAKTHDDGQGHADSPIAVAPASSKRYVSEDQKAA